MNCRNHPETQATAYCRECGKPMCGECECRALGSIYCAEHAPATVTVAPELPAPSFLPPPPSPPPSGAAYEARQTSQGASSSEPASPYTAEQPRVAPDHSAHPILAMLLGFIPGVGAIYNGQYAKGLIHAVIFGLLVTIESRGAGGLEPLVGILIAAWVFYMVFEAYHTAAKRRHGVEVEEFSSLIEARHNQGRFPTGAIVLIAVGFILLLDTTDLINMERLSRYWPVGLIVLGAFMLYNRTAPQRTHSNSTAEQGARQ